MRGQGGPHSIRIGLPPTGRTFNVGEEKRHYPRGGTAGSADTSAESHNEEGTPLYIAGMPHQRLKAPEGWKLPRPDDTAREDSKTAEGQGA